MEAKSYLLPAFAALISIGASNAGNTARADATIVSEITTSGIPTAAAQAAGTPTMATSTTYFKSGLWRTETDGAVVLSGGPDGKTYSLNSTAKTYSVLDTSKAMSAALNNPMLSMLKFHTKADVHPAGETKTIAGKPAKNYKFSATVHMSMGDGDDPATDAMMPTIKISGEEWASEAMDLPVSPLSGGVGGMSKLLPGPLVSGFSSLTTQIAAIKGYPLANTMTIKFVFPEGSPAAAMAGGQIPSAITITTTTKSVSDAPLSDTLFHVPADYKLVEAPASPALPVPGDGPAATPAPATAPPVTAPPATTPPVAPPATPPLAA